MYARPINIIKRHHLLDSRLVNLTYDCHLNLQLVKYLKSHKVVNFFSLSKQKKPIMRLLHILTNNQITFTVLLKHLKIIHY